MLTQINIRNIVLIEQCDISLSQGLCVLSGETGAGKSILLDALGLVLGARSETRLIRHGKDQSSVTATFDISNNINAKNTLNSFAIDECDELIIRRVISSDGKTKCFINDVTVGVGLLKSIGENLIEVHGQHDGRGLLDSSTHREFLDLYGEFQELLVEVKTSYQEWNDFRNKLAEAIREINEAEKEKDYLQYMQKELSVFAASANEESELAEKRAKMMNYEKFSENLNDALKEMKIGKGVVGQISSSQRILARSQFSSKVNFTKAIEALERAANEAEEAENLITNLLRDSNYDQNKLEQIEERLFAIRTMARKYNVTPQQLPDLLAEVNEKLSKLTNSKTLSENLQKSLIKAKEKYIAKAEELSKRRKKSAKLLEQEVAAELEKLKMGATIFHIMLERLEEDKYSPNGIDAIMFQAATNKGASLAPLNKIASGGELSRFMLAMKVALAKVKSTPTLIFDEIDTGTGGAVADAIGKRLAKLGMNNQVLVVTHSPQVAACGNYHLHIMKNEKNGETFTSVKHLSEIERKEELARMLSGENITDEARIAAGKLLKEAV
ncbi:MAG: DNA repair protein RecN [Pseudomonadota bacterium]